jgi:RimJ/RimL family protein N-acetyltransferase
MARAGQRPPESLSDGELLLERWKSSDAGELHAAVTANAEHLSPWLAWANDTSETAISTFLDSTARRWESAERFEYAIRARREGTLLGGAGLIDRIGSGGLELGYWVDARHARRRIATRAAAMLVATALRLPGVERVEIHHDAANSASAGVPALLGFRRVGVFPGFAGGAPAETGREVRWRLEAAEFPASAAAAMAGAG